MSQMRNDVIAIVNSIPEGRVCTYGAIARFLTISPRNVAFVLAGLSKEEAKYVPWHRVVSAGGWLNRDRKAGDNKQERRLRKEGVKVTGQRIDLQTYQLAVDSLDSGITGGKIYKPG